MDKAGRAALLDFHWSSQLRFYSGQPNKKFKKIGLNLPLCAKIRKKTSERKKKSKPMFLKLKKEMISKNQMWQNK